MQICAEAREADTMDSADGNAVAEGKRAIR